MPLAHPYVWGSLGAYCLAYVAALLMLRFNAHDKGCFICNRYGELCGCGYLGKYWDSLEKFRIWLDNEVSEDSLASRAILITFMITLPIIVGLVFVVTHVVNPLHRRKCLADILTGDPVEEEV